MAGDRTTDPRGVSAGTSFLTSGCRAVGPVGKTVAMDNVVELEHLDGGIALVTLTNGKVNALSGAVVGRIGEIAAELTATPPKVVVVTGGPKIFAAGADISEFGGAEEAVGITERIHVALDALAAIPRFVIAEVSGYALGGGCELALACDYRIARSLYAAVPNHHWIDGTLTGIQRANISGLGVRDDAPG